MAAHNLNSIPRPTQLAHLLLAGLVREGDCVIDATCGNGHDTLFLARCVGPSGRVTAYDVQAEAIAATRQRLEAENLVDRVSFQQMCHSSMEEHTLESPATAVLFNLGYLPGGDHAIATTTSRTLLALDAASRIIKPGGWLCVTCYPGHDGGDHEASAVLQWMETQPGHGWKVARYGMIGTLRPAPFLLLAAKPS